MAPFALLGLRGEPPRANLVAGYDVSRSLFEPIGRATIELDRRSGLSVAEGDAVELWLGDLAVNRRWLAFKGWIADYDAAPELRLDCADAGHWLSITETPEPPAGARQPASFWVQWAVERLPAAQRPTLELDLPGARAETRTNRGHYAGRKREARSTPLSEVLRTVAERYKIADHLGEDISYYFTLSGALVWRPWSDPGADAHRVEYGKNLVALDLGRPELGRAHRCEILPAPWVGPGDVFYFAERADSPRLAAGRYRVDAVRHFRQGGSTRSELFSRRAL